jgi:hypothetical protein
MDHILAAVTHPCDSAAGQELLEPIAEAAAVYRAPSARSRLKAALIKARWVNACG